MFARRDGHGGAAEPKAFPHDFSVNTGHRGEGRRNKQKRVMDLIVPPPGPRTYSGIGALVVIGLEIGAFGEGGAARENG